MPEPPAGSPPAMFLGAMIPTGYFAFVKVLEIIGGILVAIPRRKPIGLLAIGPIVVNILCFHIFLTKGAGLFSLPLLVASLSLFLLWVNRAAFSSSGSTCAQRTKALKRAIKPCSRRRIRSKNHQQSSKQNHQSSETHSVGDGFPVRSVFDYNGLGRELSPFLLLDYAAPHHFAPGEEKRGVAAHPHKGVETVTVAYQGELEHRDSSGGGGKIGAVDVQWLHKHRPRHRQQFAHKPSRGIRI